MIVNPGVTRRAGRERPTLRLDFVTPGASLDSRITFTRASSGTYFDSAGVLATALTDVSRLDYTAITGASPLGLLNEEARTNVVLWNRDLTNAAWTATDVTVAKTATGIDGVANSASTLTATDANGTVLQSITLASSARFQSAWVKRRTGTGNIDMTTDGGTTWGAIVPTASWTRLTIATQTLANPEVGFRIVTSGDAIDVDFVQNENGTFATSAIATTTASVTRAADVCSILTSAFPFNASAVTVFAEFQVPQTNAAVGWRVWELDGTDNIRLRNNGSGSLVVDGPTNLSMTSGVITTSVMRSAAAWAANDAALSTDGAAAVTDATFTMPSDLTRLTLGASSVTASRVMNGYFRRLAIYPRRLPNAQLQALTA